MANTLTIQCAIERAQQAQADVVVFPELALCGYPPEDLLLRADFMSACAQHFQTLCTQASSMAVIIGLPHLNEQGQRFNAAAVILPNEAPRFYCKQALPNYGVFDEKRYFIAGDEPLRLTIKGQVLSLAICEDLWVDDTATPICESADVVISLNASPFSEYRLAQRHALAKKRTTQHKTTLIYCNQVGGQDELVFDGGSFVMNAQGELCLQMACFKPEQALFDTQKSNVARINPSPFNDLDLLHQALVLSIQDYVEKNGFQSILLGLSGGIDSALCLALCIDALGAERTTAVMMPYHYTSELSQSLAQQQADLEGVSLLTLPIATPVEAVLQSLHALTAQPSLSDLTQQNLQARMRGLMLMALSNEHNHLLITTGNKSEMAVGYATLYGDMCGGFAPLKDVSKTRVYQLAHHLNQMHTRIPIEVITRAPSAELAPNQQDSDNLPEYEVLDAMLSGFVEDGAAVTATSETIIKKTIQSEYKRRQSPPGAKVSKRAFGRERRYPITQGFFK